MIGKRFSFIFILLSICTVSFAVRAPSTPTQTYPAFATEAQTQYPALPTQAAGVLATLKQQTGHDWKGYARNDGFASWHLFGAGLVGYNPVSESDAFEQSEAILAKILPSLYNSPIELQRATANHAGARWYVEFRQIIGGILVHGATVALRFDSQGRVTLLQLGAVNPLNVPPFTGIGENSAKSLTEATIKGTVDHVESAWLVRDGDFSTGPKLIPTYYVTADVASDNRPALFIDAQSGAIVAGWNRVNFDRAYANVKGVVRPAHLNDSIVINTLRFDSVRFNSRVWAVTDTNGNASANFTGRADSVYDTAQVYLRGRFANVRPYESTISRARITTRSTDTIQVLFNSTNSLAAEPNMYWHLNNVRTWMKGLNPGFDSLAYAIPAKVERLNYDNAYWDGRGVNFGDGGGSFYSFSMFCDVIYHEYHHGVSQFQYIGSDFPYSGETGAMNEAWSDYFACSMTNDPNMGEGGLFRDGSAYMRLLTNVFMYPRDIINEVHYDGMIISGAMWDLRASMGTHYADSVLHFSKYAHAASFVDYFVDILEYDDDDGDLTNGTPNSNQIYAAFGRHGIGPGSTVRLKIKDLTYRFDGLGGSIGNGNRYFDQDESLAVTFTLRNDAILYPPPAQNVRLQFFTLDSNLVLPVIDTAYTLAAHDSMLCGTYLIRNSSATSRYAKIFIAATADGGFSTLDSFRLLVGHPRILMVSKDTSSYNVRFVTNTLDSLHVGYYLVKAGSNIDPTTIMPDHDRLIWMGGDNQTLMSDNDAAAIVDFLNRGGKMVLSGQYMQALTNFPPLLALLHFSLGIQVTPTIQITHIDPIPGSPFASVRTYLTGGEGAGNTRSPSVLLQDSSALPVYRYDQWNNETAAFVYGEESHPERYRVLVTGFGIESINQPYRQPRLYELFERTFAWFDGTLSAPEIAPQLPMTFKVSTYPNPFNSELRVNVQVPNRGTLKMQLIDVLGRTVWTEMQPVQPGNFTTTINGSRLTSGLYFLRIETGGRMQSLQKVTLLK